MTAGRREVTGAWKAAFGASAVLAAGAGLLADPAAGATAVPVERASATAVSILTPGERAAGGIPAVFAWEAPATKRGYRFPDDGSLVRVGRATASAERGSGDGVEASASAVLRAVELFGGLLQVDVVRARASLTAGDGGITDGSGSHLVHVRLNGDPVKLVTGEKLWVKGWGYAVVDEPAARNEPTGAGDTLAGLRLHLTSAHAGLPAGTDIILGRVHADLAHVPPATADGGGSGETGTLPDRQANLPRKHRPARQYPTRHRHRTRPSKPAPPHPAHTPRRPAPVEHPATPPLRAAHGAGARAAIVRAAVAQVGWPYVWGGESRTEGGFDCSGLVDHAYARGGFALPGRPTADVLWAMSVPIRPADLRPGDLVFLGTRSGLVHHVGLYAGDGWVIAAPHRDALVEVEPLTAVPWDGFGRILQAPRGRILSARLLARSDRRPAVRPGRKAHAPARTVTASGAAAISAATPLAHRPAPAAPPRRRHRAERLAALPREEFRHWAVSLLASFRGAGR